MKNEKSTSNEINSAITKISLTNQSQKIALSDPKSDARAMNLAGMILSLYNNNSNEWQKPEELFDIFIHSKSNDYGRAYKEALINSKECLMDQSKLRKNLLALKVNDASSALVIPLLGTGHLWSTVIKKTSEGYHAVVINKGLRFWHDPVEEFVFNNEIKNGSDGLQRLMGALKSAKKPPVLGMLPPPKSINTVYESFIKYSDQKYNINQTFENQKVGNCFTINLYSGIKFVQATLNMSHEEWKNYRNPEPYTAFGTNDREKTSFKWDNSNTEKMKKSIIDELAVRHPNIAPKVLTLWDIYLANRNLRKDIKEGKNLLESMEQNFNPLKLNQDMPSAKRLELYFSLLSPNNFRKYYPEISTLTKKFGTPNLAKDVEKMNTHFELTDLYSKVMYMSFFFAAKQDTMKSLVRLFDRDGKETKDMTDNNKLDYLFEKAHPMTFRQYKPEFISIIKECNPDKDMNFVMQKFQQYQTASEGKFRVLDGRMEQLVHDLPELKQKYPHIAKDLAASSATFMQLAALTSNLFTTDVKNDLIELLNNDNFEKLWERIKDPKFLKENLEYALDYAGRQQKDKEYSVNINCNINCRRKLW